MPVAADNTVWLNEYNNTGFARKVELAAPPLADLTGWKLALYRWTSSVLTWTSTASISGAAGANGTWVSSTLTDTTRGIALIDPNGVVAEAIYFEVDTTGAAANPTTGPAAGVNFTRPTYTGSTSLQSRARKGTGNLRTNHTTWEYQNSTLGSVNTGQSFVAPDTTPPSVPTGLAVSAVTTNTVDLTWTASTDAVGVTEYRLYRDGTLLDSTVDLSYSDAGLTPSTDYSYTVSALDGVGNESAQSAPVVGTTSAVVVDPPLDPDPEPPAEATTGQSVADFMGQGDNTELVAMADEHVSVVRAMARAYTRGGGFTSTGGNAELEAVITTASARLVANPEQLDTTVGGVRTGAGFSGWTLAETFVLNRYRRRAQ